MKAFAWLGAVLLVLWVVAWLVLKVVSGLVHVLLVIGLALLIWGLLKRGASAIRQR